MCPKLPWRVQFVAKLYVRCVIEDVDDQSHEDKTSKKEESYNSLVNILVRLMLRTISRNITAQPYGGPGYEDIVRAVQVGPARLKQVQDKGGEEDEEHKEDNEQDGKV